jgi:hypothetical protein
LIPTPENPFLFILGGAVPALKNEKIISTDIHGVSHVRSSAAVEAWYKKVRGLVQIQMMGMTKLDSIQKPNVAYVRFEMFCEDAMSKVDLDNAYTSCQEWLQPSGKHKGIVGIIPDDKYVQGFSAVRLPLDENEGPKAHIWVWQYEGDDIDQLNIWKEHRKRNLDKRIPKKTIPDKFFD